MLCNYDSFGMRVDISLREPRTSAFEKLVQFGYNSQGVAMSAGLLLSWTDGCPSSWTFNRLNDTQRSGWIARSRRQGDGLSNPSRAWTLDRAEETRFLATSPAKSS